MTNRHSQQPSNIDPNKGPTTDPSERTQHIDPHQPLHENNNLPDLDTLPEPIDPFYAGQNRNSNKTVSDSIETNFQSLLEKALNPTTTQKPDEPTPETTPTASQNPTEQNQKRVTNNPAKARGDTPPRNTITPDTNKTSSSDFKPGSLHHKIHTHIEETPEIWEYSAAIDTHNNLHHKIASEQNNELFVLTENPQQYTIQQYKRTTDESEKSPDRELTYNAFNTAYAAFIEGVDWGMLPHTRPEIWTYTGYTNDHENFNEYTKQVNTRIHTWVNNTVDYTITLQNHTTNSEPKTSITISTHLDSTHTRTIPLYRKTFHNPFNAITTVCSLLSNELSHIFQKDSTDPDLIATEANKLPPLEKLLSQD